MAAKFYLAFSDPYLRAALAQDLRRKIMLAPTFAADRPSGELWLKGVEHAQARWPYDVRFFTEALPRIMFEVSAHPPSAEADLKDVFAWLRSQAVITIVDDDGETSRW